MRRLRRYFLQRSGMENIDATDANRRRKDYYEECTDFSWIICISAPLSFDRDQDNFLNLDFHYFAMWNYCFGIQLDQASSEEIAAIKQTEEYQKLDSYPSKNCIAVIHDIIVIKLPEE